MKFFFFPQTCFEDEVFDNNISDLTVSEYLDHMRKVFLKRGENIKSIKREDLEKTYHEEKETIKRKGYKIVSSYLIRDFDSVKKIVEFVYDFTRKHNIDTCFQIDLILYNKINLFLREDFRDERKIFILKSFPLLEYLSVENIKQTNLDFCVCETERSQTGSLDVKIFLNKLREEAKKNNFENEIFFLSDGFFSLERKTISIFLMKTKIL